ncbi:MAG: hypothetical protein KA419_17975 [Acidobacteria bacterium]|nr:hypothetical protein [Acidobacteriota bacterium]
MARINRNKNPEPHEKGCDPTSFDRFSRRKRYISLGHSSALPVPRAIRQVWGFAELTGPQRFPPGVHRHRTIEDAQRLRDQWDDANFRALWERRTTGREFLRDDRRDP